MIKIDVGFRKGEGDNWYEEPWWNTMCQAFETWEDLEDFVKQWNGRYCIDRTVGHEWIEFDDERDVTLFLLRWM